MMNKLSVLVTGCGGDIAQSMGKILRGHPMVNKVVGTDLHLEHAGQFLFDQCFVIERADSPQFGQLLSELLQREQIDVIIPSTEFELRYLLRAGHHDLGRSVYVGPSDQALQVGLDKLSTARFLEEHNLPFPKTVLLDGTQPPFLPCIIKPRSGSGSKTLHRVTDAHTFAHLSSLLKNCIVQEYLEDDDEEYTCAVFRSGSGITRTIAFRRKLTGGYSGFGVLIEHPAIDALLIRLAEQLQLRGSINVQLRLRHGVPMVFEINARFSSTVLFRHLLGYEDVIWSIQDRLNMPLSDYQPAAVGSKFYKGFQEYIVKA